MQKTTFEFTYSQNGVKLQVTAVATNRPAGIVTDIDAIMYKGIDVHELIESLDMLDDIQADAEMKAEGQFVNFTEYAEID